MKVSKTKSGKSTSAISYKKGVAGKGKEFAEHLKGAVPVSGVSGATDSSSVNSVDAILSIQETGDTSKQRARRLGVQYGVDLLNYLEELRRDLLLGVVEKNKLGSIAQKMRAHRRQSEDEKLNEIIDEIELRAEVEIAKLTR